MKGKLYRSRLATIDRQQAYTCEDAVKVLKDMPAAKFDETVELAFRLGVDPRQSDQVVRGAMVLPNGTGKTVRVVVIASGEAAQVAEDAGADEVGFEEIIERIQGGWLDFDVVIATPAAMQKVRTLGRVLGPRGLMPNPKTGTVTDDTAAAVKEAKAGRIEYRTDRTGCVHMPVGKLSFSNEALQQNIMAAVNTILQARPVSAKGTFLQNVVISATMSPGIRLDTRTITKAYVK